MLDARYSMPLLLRELLSSAVVPTFLNGITGHGFLKIMRADADTRYEITDLPQVPEVLQYLIEELGMSPTEAYGTLNMGAGYVVIVRPDDVDEAVRVAQSTGHEALLAGEVVAGRRALSIQSLGIEYADDDVQLR